MGDCELQDVGIQKSEARIQDAESVLEARYLFILNSVFCILYSVF
jgi:hypothetical protein